MSVLERAAPARKGGTIMWAYDSVFYQIYTLGFCGCPDKNEGVPGHRLQKVADWIPHIRRIHADAVYFTPVFDSDAHGYDTRDYTRIDGRLGTNGEFAALCRTLHESGIRVVLDGVFNHVGRGFWAFQDLLKNREASPYRDWFFVRFDGNNGYDDGLWYEGWEGHDELVKLNLRNEEVAGHLLGCVEGWIREFGIDGLRLDVAYSLEPDFIRRLRRLCDALKPDFFLVGEMLHGDYRRLVCDGMLHSATNYECYKGLHSSLNSDNLFEIGHSLQRQFGPEPWTVYKGLHLFNFADNHDVTRAASILRNPAQLPLLYALLFAMPGIPCVYYGSEWGAEGVKSESDAPLRPCFPEPAENGLTRFIASLAAARRESPALRHGDFRILLMTNRQLIFERRLEGERMLAAFNAEAVPYTAHFDAGAGRADELLTGRPHDFGGGSELNPYSASYWRIGG